MYGSSDTRTSSASKSLMQKPQLLAPNHALDMKPHGVAAIGMHKQSLCYAALTHIPILDTTHHCISQNHLGPMEVSKLVPMSIVVSIPQKLAGIDHPNGM